LRSDFTGFIFGKNALSTYSDVKTVYETLMAPKLKDSNEPRRPLLADAFNSNVAEVQKWARKDPN
jgi:hypothetical protein